MIYTCHSFQPNNLIKLWIEEFLSKVASSNIKFIALHCQEVGGKNYEKSMKHVEQFIQLLTGSTELQNFSRGRVFLDEDYTSVENFTVRFVRSKKHILTKFLKALGNIYFIHNSVSEALIWDFKQSEFVPVQDLQVFSGNIETVDTKEKSKFPQHFFPEVGIVSQMCFCFIQGCF